MSAPRLHCRWLAVADGFMRIAQRMAALAAEAYAKSVDVRAANLEAAARAWADELAELRYLLRVERLVLERLERDRDKLLEDAGAAPEPPASRARLRRSA